MKSSFTVMRQITNNPNQTAQSSRVCVFVCVRNHGIIRDNPALI